MRRFLIVLMWLMILASASCGVKGPPLPPETSNVDVATGPVYAPPVPKIYGPKNRDE